VSFVIVRGEVKKDEEEKLKNFPSSLVATGG